MRKLRLRVSIWLPLVGLLASFTWLSVDTYLQIAKALQDDAVSRKTPDSLLLKKVFTSPVPADVDVTYTRNRIIRDAIKDTHRNTLVSVYRRQGAVRIPIVNNVNDIGDRVPKEVEEYGVKLAQKWDAQQKDYQLALGEQFVFNGTNYHVIGRRFPMTRREASDSGELILITNLDSTIAATRNIFVRAQIKTASVVVLWSLLAILINVLPVVRLTRKLNIGQPLQLWAWVPRQFADLANQLELDREANLRFRAEADAFRASIDLKSRVIEMSTVPTLICKLPKDGKQAIVTYANKAVHTQFGYENLVGEPLNLLVPPEFGGYHTWGSIYDDELGRDIGMAVCPHHAKSRVIGQQRPVPVIAKDGIRLQALLSVDRIADDEDGSRNFIGTLQDITSLVEAKESAQVAKREAEEYAAIARGVINNITDAIVFLKDADGVYQLSNTAFAKIAGRDPIGLKDADLAWTPEEAAKYRQEDLDVLASGEAFSTLEQIGGGAESHWYITRKIPAMILGKQSVLGVSLDVDDLIKAKNEAEHYSKQIEENQRIWRHDLLSTAKGVYDMFELLEIMGFEVTEEGFSNTYAMARRAAESCYNLIKETRKLGSVEGDIKLSPYSVKKLFDDLVPKYTQYNVIINAPIEDDTIMIDRAEFVDRALCNLINNAIRYSNPPNERVELTYRTKGDLCYFLVKDNGVGMTPEGVEKVMNGMGEGIRLNPQIQGTGLGLYSARRIVAAHGGEITVRSKLGEGSIFIVSIPRKS